jgi:hypothetical protein
LSPWQRHHKESVCWYLSMVYTIHSVRPWVSKRASLNLSTPSPVSFQVRKWNERCGAQTHGVETHSSDTGIQFRPYSSTLERLSWTNWPSSRPKGSPIVLINSRHYAESPKVIY